MDRILSLEDGVIVERTEVRARAARGD